MDFEAIMDQNQYSRFYKSWVAFPMVNDKQEDDFGYPGEEISD